jgi:abhydrolase domain-containing protein 17
LRSFFLGLVLLAAAIYLLLVVVSLFLSDQMIFHPQRAGYRDDDKTIKLKSADGAKISAIYLPNPAAVYTVLFSHGNAEDIGDSEALLEVIRAAGFAVFAYDYQGYGTSEGKPTERHAYEDEDAAYNYMVHSLNLPPHKIIAFGRSVGGGPATDLASRRPLAGLILESAFTSAFRVLTGLSILPFDKFNNLQKIGKVHCPTLVIHGLQDQVVNQVHGKKLYNAANDPKQFLWVEKAGHNDVAYVGGGRYVEALTKFGELVRQQQDIPVH